MANRTVASLSNKRANYTVNTCVNNNNNNNNNKLTQKAVQADSKNQKSHFPPLQIGHM